MTTLAEAQALDAADPLSALRDRFALPKDVIYLDGNSLGALPKATIERQRDVVTREWGEDLIRSWNSNDWIGAPARIGGKIAPLIGAAPSEVIVTDSTTANLFKLIVAATRHMPDRAVILTEPGNFPTDLYAVGGASELLGGRSVRLERADRIIEAVDADTALVLLTHVHYKTGARHDMAAITAAAHEAGALMLWDLSHSAGAVTVDLNACGVDLAVGCGYKYLNGGPGAPAFLFVAERLQEALRSPLAGWMGHADPFAFRDEYKPAPGVSRFLCGTPPMLNLLALESGIEQFTGVDMAALATKSARLFELFAARVEEHCESGKLRLITPREPERRGSHISFANDHAWPIMQALIARGVIGDFRAPDILRFGLTPLYLGCEDIWRATETLGDIIDSGQWRETRFQERLLVT